MLKPRIPSVLAHWAHLQENFSTSAQDVYKAIEEAVKAREAPDTTFSLVRFKEGGFGSAEREYLRVESGRHTFDICAAPYGNGFFFSSWLTQPGPKHPFLWLMGFAAATLFWLYLLLNSFAKAFQSQMLLGYSGFFGLVFVALLFGAPVLLFAWGWAISRGQMFPEEQDVLSLPILGALYFLLFNPLTYYRLDTAMMFRTTVHNAVLEVLDGLFDEQGIRALSPEERKATIRSFVQ